MQTAAGKLYLFVAIDRTAKFAVAQLVERMDSCNMWDFMERVLEAVPYRIHTTLMDYRIPCADLEPQHLLLPAVRFDMICTANEIELRLTRPNHPWTNGQVQRINRAIEDATVKR